MQVYSSRFPSRKPKTERWGQWISSRQYCNNRLLLLPLISDMCNPKNWKSSSRAKWNFSKSGWIRVLQIHRQERPGKCVFLCDLDWQLAIETSETKPRRAPYVYPVYRRSPNKQWLYSAVCRRIFSSPSLPSSLFWRVNLSLGIIFWLAPTRG